MFYIKIGKTLDLQEILKNMDSFRKECEEFELYENSGVTYLTKEDLIFLHDKQIEEFGGIYGVRDEGLLDSVSKAPYQSCFGSDLYPTIFDKAAKYLYDFSTYQVFLDGNKRTGLCTASMFLKMNGYELDMNYTQVYEMTMNLANGNIQSLEEISNLLEKNSIMDIEQDINYDYE